MLRLRVELMSSDRLDTWSKIEKSPLNIRAQSVSIAEGVDMTTRGFRQLTLRQLCHFYFEQYAATRLATAKEMRDDVHRWFESELDRDVADLTVIELQCAINRLGACGKIHAANKARNHIRAIFNWGARKRLCGADAVQALDGFRVRSRERFVRPDEFGRLFDAIRNYPDDRIRDLLLVCLFTGARSGNVMSMRWADVDFELGNWTIARTKNGDSHVIGLPDAAFEILEERFRNRGTSPWVFPGGNRMNKKLVDGHLTEPKKAWRKILRAAGIDNLRIHDLRRTAGSLMAMSGANTPTIMRALGHKSMAATAVYQRVNCDPAKRAMDVAIADMRRFANDEA